MFFFPMRRQQGFTLVELVIVIAIVSILAAIALPSYKDSIRKSHRSEAKGELTRLATAEEKWRVTNPSYGTLADIGGANPSDYYSYAVTLNTATEFKISATPLGDQVNDVCHVLFMEKSFDTNYMSLLTSDSGACPTP